MAHPSECLVEVASTEMLPIQLKRGMPVSSAKNCEVCAKCSHPRFHGIGAAAAADLRYRGFILRCSESPRTYRERRAVGERQRWFRGRMEKLNGKKSRLAPCGADENLAATSGGTRWRRAHYEELPWSALGLKQDLLRLEVYLLEWKIPTLGSRHRERLNLEPEPGIQVQRVRFGVQQRSNAEPNAIITWFYFF
ncbi:hypothetical protein B0H19DRAFT_1071624 [Mycena capillaripes]|nr:hypothetical protein B0H19DRAFT_1071624 [Mycena capillaripes]